MDDSVIEIDVRPLLEQGRSPLPLITNTASSLAAGQRLRVLTSWEPVPLYGVLASMGFQHHSKQDENGLWIVEFERGR